MIRVAERFQRRHDRPGSGLVEAYTGGTNIAEDAFALGAHVYIDTHREDAAAKLQGMGSAQTMVSTIGDATAMSALIALIAPRSWTIDSINEPEPI